MDSIIRKQEKRRAFTIVELLTVMSIIVILFSLLVPALSRVRRYAKRVNQNAQFHSISAALELFNNEFGAYPPSADPNGYYPGAMQLAEAMVGQDRFGFHPDAIQSDFDGFNHYDQSLYRGLLTTFDPQANAVDRENLRQRKGPFLPLEGTDICTMEDLFGLGNFGTLLGTGGVSGADPNGGMVICDEYPLIKSRRSGKVGMPVLYYKANTSRLLHQDITTAAQNIYDYRDNIEIVEIEVPGAPGTNHLMALAGGTTPNGDPTNPDVFYDKTWDETITAYRRPQHPEEYILQSAGFDGIYGTEDDVFNFGD